MIFAKLYMSNGDILPHQYTRDIGSRNKDLLKPIPGKYHVNYTNPFLDEEVFIPLFTNESGIVEFKELFFSVYGPAGKYMIEFNCEGVKLISGEITVTSIVDAVKIIIQPSSYITSEAGDIESQLNCLIQIVDKNGKIFHFSIV